MAFSFRRRWAAWLAGFLVLLLIGFSAWWFISPRPDGIEVRPPKPRPDLIEVLHLNNVGVGHMEKYKYADAIDAFEAVVEKDPDTGPCQPGHCLI
jgi:hypothetical protein